MVELINPQYAILTYADFITTGRWEVVRFVGQCVLTAIAYRILDNLVAYHQYPQYFNAEQTYPRLNAAVVGLHRTSTSAALISGILAWVATVPLPLVKRQVTMGPYFPYFVATLTAIFIINRFAISQKRAYEGAEEIQFIDERSRFELLFIGAYTFITPFFILDARTV